VFQKPRATSVGDCVLGTRPKFKKPDSAQAEGFRIDGTVQGTMNYPEHTLTIGTSGQVKADVRAKIIIVQGTVEGDVHGDEAVFLRHTAHVLGNIKSPRVSIDDGATFEGTIETSSRISAVDPGDERAVPDG
jgi:cytoskeletal protein CcmA (bactofilin family)